MKQLILLLLLFCSAECSFGQEIESIKKEAQKAKEQSEKNSVPNHHNGQHNNHQDQQNLNDGGSGLGGFCFNLLGGIIYTANGKYNSKQVERQVYRNKGFELDLRTGFEPGNLNLYAGKIGYNTGVFSFDCRLNNFVQRNSNGNLTSMNTFDLRYLQLNLINNKHLNLRVGTGAYFDPIGEDWSLFSGSTDYYFKDRFQVGFEYLYAGNSGTKAREEINFKLAYAWLNQPKIRLDAFVFGMNQTYYGSIRINTFGVGINIRPNLGIH
ncbi:MAG: hypothetical protein ACOVP1_01055 [Bacteroidia bacterium]